MPSAYILAVGAHKSTSIASKQCAKRLQIRLALSEMPETTDMIEHSGHSPERVSTESAPAIVGYASVVGVSATKKVKRSLTDLP